jgi:hypothetical protein
VTRLSASSHQIHQQTLRIAEQAWSRNWRDRSMALRFFLDRGFDPDWEELARELLSRHLSVDLSADFYESST